MGINYIDKQPNNAQYHANYATTNIHQPTLTRTLKITPVRTDFPSAISFERLLRRFPRTKCRNTELEVPREPKKKKIATMSRYRSDVETADYEKPSACSNFLHYSWKTVTCLFSHITLISMVVSYCVLGAFTFEALEVEHEKEVKDGIKRIRENTSLHIWNYTQHMPALEETNFTKKALVYLKEFEGALLKAINKDGWDGEEDRNKLQWTSTGALFYSIVVITTIGYGHLTPKTSWGKIVTIFYAILGIPLMLLCLSNIGDVMATSFRFLYWRVCCYVCTKKKQKKMKRGKSFRTVNKNDSRFSRSRNVSLRRSIRTSAKSADSGYAYSDVGPVYHSDTEFSYADDYRGLARGSSLPNRPARHSDVTPPTRKSGANHRTNHVNPRGGSLDRRKAQQQKDVAIEMDPVLLSNTEILCNRYVVGITNRKDTEGDGGRKGRRAVSMPRSSNYLEPPRCHSPDSSDRDETEHDSPRSRPRMKQPMGPSPKMMTPLGYGHKSKYLDDPDSDEDYYYDDGYNDVTRQRIRPVPIWLCVLLVISYILAGAYLFKSWENWDYLDAAYFCFVTLTTIGFGDLVPAKGVTQDLYHATISITLCSLYLLFGISLLAMSFNLVQEEVIANVKSVAKTLGIIKADSEDDSDDED